jgi:lambda family phage portal protein
MAVAMKSNWIDSVVGYFSPVAGVRRQKARLAQAYIEHHTRKFEAAAGGRRTDGWKTSGGSSVNAEIGPALHIVRDRTRDLSRNNPYAKRAVSGITANLVGTGIIVQASGDREKQVANANALWRDWSESTDCDADGLHDFAGLQSLAFKTAVESGESLVVRKWRKKSDGYQIPVPFQIQVLEGDYIDTAKTMQIDTGWILQGVEFDQKGRRVAYWLFTQHPGEQLLNFKKGLVSQRVPARDVRHLFRVDRAGQVRGMPWGAACVIRLRDFDEYEDAVALRMKIAACFSAFVRDLEAPTDDAAAKNSMSDKLEPGAIEILPPGKTVEFPNMPAVNDDGHSIRSLRAIAMGYDVTYELLSGDLSNVNFSSGRMGWIEFHRNIEQWRWHMFIPRFCAPVWGWFKEAAEMVGADLEGTRPTYTPPRREMIDPTKEVPATRDEARAGLKSLSEAIREQGRIPAEVFKEMKQDADTLDKLGLKLDSDPRYLARGGTAQAVSTASSSTGGGNAEEN